MWKSLYFTPEKGLETELSRERIQDILKNGQGHLWLDLVHSEEDDWRLLTEVFGFHPLAVEDCQHRSELPKLEAYDHYLFLVVLAVWPKGHGHYSTQELDIFAGERFTVTVHHQPLDIIKGVWEKAAAGAGPFAQGTDVLLHGILDRLVDDYFPVIDELDKEIEDLEDTVLAQDGTEEILSRLTRLRRPLLRMKRITSPMRDMLGRLARRDFPFISEQVAFYFRDILDHVVRLHELLETQHEVLSGILEAHFSIQSSRLSEVSNHMSLVMQRLTAITMIFMPLTFLVGVYGMNFRNIPELRWQYGYFFVWMIMIFTAAWMYRYFREKGWI